MLYILAAFVRTDVREHLSAPELIEAAYARIKVIKLVTGFADVGVIDRQHVGAINVLDVTPATFGPIFFRDVFA